MADQMTATYGAGIGMLGAGLANTGPGPLRSSRRSVGSQVKSAEASLLPVKLDLRRGLGLALSR